MNGAILRSAKTWTICLVCCWGITTWAGLSDELILYWPLDRVEGSITPDAVGTNHLTVHNLDAGHLVPGKFGQALSFNGVSQFLSLTNQGQKHLPVYSLGEFTIAMWVRGEERQENRIIFAEGSRTDRLPLFLFGTHREAKGGQLNVFVRNKGAILNNIPTDGIAFNNQWRHITWVNSGNVSKVYINGELNTEYRYERPTMALDYLSIGALFRDPPAYFFKGEIDEVAVWERTLTTREIKELVTSGIKLEHALVGAE